VYRLLQKKLRANIILPTLFILITLILTGCSSFHLRGWSTKMPTMLQKVYIESNGNYSFALTLSEHLNSIGAKVVSQKNQATSIIRLLNTNTETKTVNVIGALSATEYSQTYSISYEVLDSGENVLLEPHYISATQTYAGNSTIQLSLNNTVNETTAVLQEKVANNIVSQLYILKPSTNTIIPNDLK
jgi:outer membrane lipopolysaccharide assembly protein LptE/RlpB